MRSTQGEAAVSSVVGTVLMLAITVSVFTGFSVVVLDYIQETPHAPRAELALVQGTGSMYLVHRGGESFSRAGTLYVNNDGVQEEIALSDGRLDGVGDDWSIGDQVCIQGDDAGCLYASDRLIEGAFVVASNTLLAETGERADGTLSDLTVGLVSQSPASAGVGDTVAWTVRVTNGGERAASAGSFLVHAEVDGVLVATATVAGPLGIGGSATATTTPGWAPLAAGPRTLRLVVDPTGLVTESDEGNNEASIPFTIAVGVSDPGQPFVDLNGDGLYTPGVDSTITASEVQDGSYDAGSGSLVLPASVGDIAASTISFTAGGDIVVAVELAATTNPLSITAGGDIVFDSAELQTLNNNNDMTLTAGGSITGTGLVMDVDGSLTVTAGGALQLDGASIVVGFSNRDIALTGTSVDVTGATLVSADQLTVTATAGAISAGSVQATSGGAQLWKATGGGITLSSSSLTGTSLTACLASSTLDGLVLAGTLAFDDANDRLDARHGACNASDEANADAYVTPWPASATDSPRSKLE